MEYVKTVLTKYADFSGRADKSEFWYWVLFNIIIAIGINIIFGIFSAITDSPTILMVGTILLIIWSLGILVPNLAVAVRRLHDTNRSGAWYFIAFVPLVGVIALIVFWVQDSYPGPNQWGPEPGTEETHNAMNQIIDYK